jgi:hypothetical protein
MSTEKRNKTLTYTDRLICECGGELFYSGSGVSIGDPTRIYIHGCNKCGKIEVHKNLYPRMVYEEVKK